MNPELDLILSKLDSLQSAITVIVAEMDQTWAILEQVRAELNKTKKQYATLKALSPPYRGYARRGILAASAT